MISDHIQKTHRKDKFHQSSFFEVTFKDGSKAHENNMGWSAFSQEKVVLFLGNRKTVKVSVHPIKHIRIKHGEIETDLVVPNGCEVYQAFSSVTSVDGSSRIMGREVGIVKDGVIIEERYLDGMANKVVGVRM